MLCHNPRLFKLYAVDLPLHQVNQPLFFMILTINGQQAALKKGSSIEYVSENRIFTDADDYSMEIELPLADCPQNLDIFGMITRKDVDTVTSSLMLCKKN